MSLEARRIAVKARLILLALIILIAACSKSEKPSVSEKPSFKVFASPDDAGNALLEAAKSGDQNAVLAIFGPESKEIIYSGDAVQDKNAARRIRGGLWSDAPLAQDAGWGQDPAGRS